MAAYEEEELFDEMEAQNELYLTVPQTKFLQSTYKFPLFVAGFGSGKSQGMCVSALNDLFNYKGANVAVYAPTYDLLKLIIMSYIEEMLIAGNYSFSLNNSSHTFNVHGYGKIICRSMDNPARIVGYEVFRSHCDELDVLEEAKADLAWKKIIARNRQKVYRRSESGGRIPLIDPETMEQQYRNGYPQWETEINRVSAYTTPEGFKFAYKRWVKLPDPHGHYGIIKASTHSNAQNLPDDYISTLIASYPKELIEAYINGEFINLTSGAVYRNFDRDINCKKLSVKEKFIVGETLHVGMDFNIEHGAAAICVMRGQDLYAIDEIHDSYDTDDTVRILNERYPNNPINIYPDATGKKRSSANGAPSATDIAKLKKAGFNVIVDYSNPMIKDRVNCVNAKIVNGEGIRSFFIDEDKCPNLVETLEQQVWDSNGMPDKSTGLDHMGDAIGYLIYKLFPIIRQNAAFATVRR